VTPKKDEGTFGKIIAKKACQKGQTYRNRLRNSGGAPYKRIGLDKKKWDLFLFSYQLGFVAHAREKQGFFYCGPGKCANSIKWPYLLHNLQDVDPIELDLYF